MNQLTFGILITLFSFYLAKRHHRHQDRERPTLTNYKLIRALERKHLKNALKKILADKPITRKSGTIDTLELNALQQEIELKLEEVFGVLVRHSNVQLVNDLDKEDWDADGTSLEDRSVSKEDSLSNKYDLLWEGDLSNLADLQN